MNERIQELAVASGGHEVAPYDYLFRQKEMQKFAELIIQECIEQIQLSTARDPRDTPQYRQSVGHIHRIRQHFGVE